MSDSPAVNLNDLLGSEEQVEDTGAQPVRNSPPPSVLEKLKKEYTEVNQRLMHALSHDYDGYKVDTDKDGQAHFGKRGYANYERDKLRRDELRDQIRDTQEREREDRTSAQASFERAKQLVKTVFEREIRFVNKEHHKDLQSLYLHSLKGIDWSSPQLRTDTAKEGMLSMVFGWSANEIRKRRQQAGKAPGGERIDGEHEEGEGDQEPKENEYGFSEGSVGYDITQQFADRMAKRQSGPLGGRGRK